MSDTSVASILAKYQPHRRTSPLRDALAQLDIPTKPLDGYSTNDWATLGCTWTRLSGCHLDCPRMRSLCFPTTERFENGGSCGAKSAYIYELRSEDADLLYIGMTVYPFKRLGQHLQTQLWAEDISRVVVHGPFAREKATKVEKTLIACCRPKYNIVHHPGNEKKRTTR